MYTQFCSSWDRLKLVIYSIRYILYQIVNPAVNCAGYLIVHYIALFCSTVESLLAVQRSAGVSAKSSAVLVSNYSEQYSS